MTTTAAPTPAPYLAAEVAAAITRARAKASDRPDPPPDAICTPQKYAALAQESRTSAWQHLNDGDLPQASNKAWDIVAETVKDISARHGAIIYYYLDISDVINELARLAGNAGDTDTARWIRTTFLVASSLFHNYNENEFPKDLVRFGLMECEEFSELLYNRFGVV